MRIFRDYFDGHSQANEILYACSRFTKQEQVQGEQELWSIRNKEQTHMYVAGTGSCGSLCRGRINTVPTNVDGAGTVSYIYTSIMAHKIVLYVE